MIWLCLLSLTVGVVIGWFLSEYQWNEALDRAMREYVKEPE